MKNFLYFIGGLVFVFSFLSAIPILTSGDFGLDALPFMASTGLGIGLGAALMGIGYLCGKANLTQEQTKVEHTSDENEDKKGAMIGFWVVAAIILLIVIVGNIVKAGY